MCDTILIVRSDRVLFAKNSNRDPNEAQLLDWQPRHEHDAGTIQQCTWIEIPQARNTHAVLLSRPFWMWGAEIGANEHHVVIGNEAVFTNQKYRKVGLTGMDLVRLGLERAATAREAVEVITELLERHGQGGGCGHEKRSFTYHNSFLVADPSSAFVLETADRHWQAEEVVGAHTISNGLTIPGFAERYSDRVKTWGSRCRIRQRLTSDAAATSQSVADLMAILRDHGDGRVAPAYNLLTGAMSAPCVHPGGVAANQQTVSSWVAELSNSGTRHWVTGTAAPCTGLFKPVRVREPLDLGPDPTDRADVRSLWWRHERLHRRTMRDPERLLPLFLPERDEIERGWLADPPEPLAAFAEGGRLLTQWMSRVNGTDVPDTRPRRLRRYWHVRNRRAGLD
jgi:dipeptidase